MRVSVFIHAMGRSEDTFYNVGPRDEIGVIRLSSEWLYLLTHLASPDGIFLNMSPNTLFLLSPVRTSFLSTEFYTPTKIPHHLFSGLFGFLSLRWNLLCWNWIFSACLRKVNLADPAVLRSEHKCPAWTHDSKAGSQKVYCLERICELDSRDEWSDGGRFLELSYPWLLSILFSSS